MIKIRPEELYRKNKEMDEAEDRIKKQLAEMPDKEILEGVQDIIDIRNITFKSPDEWMSFFIQNQIILAEAIRRIYERL